MKSYLLISLISFTLLTNLHAQSGQQQKAIRINQEIVHLAGHIPDYNVNNEYQLEEWNDKLVSKIQQYTLLTPDFLQKDFPEWREKGIEITTSADRKLRIVFWNNQTGGTLREYTALIFWQGTDGLKNQLMQDVSNSSFSFLRAFKKKNGKTFYLANGMMHESNRDKVDFIKAYQIEGNSINDSITVFKTPRKKLNEISVSLDMGTVTTDRDFIHFSKDEKTLYIPVVNAKSEVKKDYFLIYQFDGNEFVFQKTTYLK